MKLSYRAMLQEAARLTYRRKGLWCFGILAGLVSTGSVWEIALRVLYKVEHVGSLLTLIMENAVGGYETFGWYIRQLALLPTARVTTTVTLILLTAITIIVTGVISQGALLTGLNSPRPTSARHNWAAGLGRFWDILIIDLLAKLAYLVLILLIVLLTQSGAGSFLLFLVFFPSLLIISLLAALAVVHAGKTCHHALDSLHTAITILRRDWVSALWFSLAVFSASTLSLLTAGAILILLSVPYSILIYVALLTSPLLFLITNAVSLVIFMVIAGALLGAVVTFQYASWTVYHRELAPHYG